MAETCISHRLKIADYDPKYVLLACEVCGHVWKYVPDPEFVDQKTLRELRDSLVG